MNILYLCILFACDIVRSSLGNGKLDHIQSELSKAFDLQHPPLAAYYKGKPVNSVQSRDYHPKRCIYTEPGKAVDAFKESVFNSYLEDQFVLVSTPCLFSDSMGNWLSNYFEILLCANAAGLHFAAVAKVWEPSTNDTASPFLMKLPSIVVHQHPVSSRESAIHNVATFCTCRGVCHENPRALWTRGIDVIKPLLWAALQHHRKKVNVEKTIVSSSDISNRPVGSELPFVPEAVVHYRCGDNFVGHYGFLPFSAFTRNIPVGVKSIFVLAEQRSRKTSQKPLRALKCDAVFDALFSYLTKNFPNTAVLIRRGDDLVLDMYRLAAAKVTICSVSTFCLWPAIINEHNAYFPASKLVVKKDTSMNVGLKWITEPHVVLGAPNEHLSAEQFVALLLK
jgi:hypothetical protein